MTGTGVHAPSGNLPALVDQDQGQGCAARIGRTATASGAIVRSVATALAVSFAVLACPSPAQADPSDTEDAFFCPASDQAGAADRIPQELRIDRTLGSGRIKGAGTLPGPVYSRADQTRGESGVNVVLDGRVELRRDGVMLRGDHASYEFETDRARVQGNVALSQNTTVFTGPSLDLRLEAQQGQMPDARYQYLSRHASGESRLIEFLGQDSVRLNQATYSTCAPDNPAWWVKAARVDIDESTKTAVANDTTLYFEGLPLFWWPGDFQFPLGYERRSGFLTPGFGQSSNMGASFSVPYYLNIAPNRDDTLTTDLMPSHGLAFNNEFRFLEPHLRGIFNYDIMPHDRSTGTARSHTGLQSSYDGANGFRADVNYTHVSDDTYLTDFSRNIYSASQEVLTQDISLAYNDPYWHAGLQLAKSQTLISLLSVGDPGPYEKVPDLSLAYRHADWNGWDVLMNLDATRFQHPAINPCYQPPESTLLATPAGSTATCPQVVPTLPYSPGWFSQSGSRFIANPSVSYPLITPAAFLVPRLQWHFTDYGLDPDFNNGARSATRSLPLMSLDAGLVFERPLDWFGLPARQTLEPRAFYAFVPFRQQALLPNYDSADADFTFAQLFTENTFTGSDRISQANQVTSALTTRVIDEASGAERLRLAIGQRFYFSPQKVTLPGEVVRTSNASDSLFLGSASLGRRWNADLALDYDNQTSSLAVANFALRWQPALSSVFNLVYHFETAALAGTTGNVNQPRISVQWPLSAHWYGVGVVDYSTTDRALSQGIAGFEYKADCWVARLALSRYAIPLPNSNSLSNQYNNTLYFQIEFNGLTPIGYNNPLDALQSNIPGYQRINPPMAPAGPFDYYR